MTAVARAGLLVLLLALSHVLATQASLSIVLRVAFLSFDNPSTQYHDELASQSAPCADTTGETLACARVAATTPSRFVAVPVSGALATAALLLGITRSPPTV